MIPKLYAVITSTFSQHADRCATKYLPFRVSTSLSSQDFQREYSLTEYLMSTQTGIPSI